MLPKTSAYVKSFDGQTKWMYFLIEDDDDLLEKYVLSGIKSVLTSKRNFYNKPLYDKNFLKTKIKSHGDKVTNFYDKEIPKADSN